MKLKKCFAQVASIALVAAMSLSMVGCSNPFKKLTVEDVLTKVEENQPVSTSSIEKLLKQDSIDGDDIQKLLKEIPSYEAEVGTTLKGSINGEEDGESHKVSADLDGKVNLSYDSKNQSIAMNINGEANAKLDGTKVGQEIDMSLYLINEDGTYYAYKVADGDAERMEIGDVDDIFDDVDIDVEDLLEELGVESAEELFESVAKDSLTEHKDEFTMEKDKVEKNGVKCYVLKRTIEGKQLIKTLEKNEAFQDYLDENDMDFDEFMSETLGDSDITIEDIIKKINLEFTYYVTDETFYITYMEVDMTKCISDVADLIKDAAAEEILNKNHDYDVDIDISIDKVTMYYSLIIGDQKVKFTGDYEDVDSFDSYGFY